MTAEKRRIVKEIILGRKIQHRVKRQQRNRRNIKKRMQARQ